MLGVPCLLCLEPFFVPVARPTHSCLQFCLFFGRRRAEEGGGGRFPVVQFFCFLELVSRTLLFARFFVLSFEVFRVILVYFVYIVLIARVFVMVCTVFFVGRARGQARRAGRLGLLHGKRRPEPQHNAPDLLPHPPRAHRGNAMTIMTKGQGSMRCYRNTRSSFLSYK